jgi:hypothetical protein
MYSVFRTQCYKVDVPLHRVSNAPFGISHCVIHGFECPVRMLFRKRFERHALSIVSLSQRFERSVLHIGGGNASNAP